LVKIRFLDTILPQSLNLTEFDSRILNLKLIVGEYNDPAKLNFTWNATKFDTEYLYI